MIHYQLQCRSAHAFDGWFRDSAAFDEQVAGGLLECPSCGERSVSRALMAPALGRRGNRKVLSAPPETALDAPDAPAEVPASVPAVVRTPAPDRKMPPMAVQGGPVPAQLRAALSRIRSMVEQNCDYVGPDFATEARRIHDGEAAARGIYGEATPAEVEALADDGIEIARVPWVPRTDS